MIKVDLACAVAGAAGAGGVLLAVGGYTAAGLAGVVLLGGAAIGDAVVAPLLHLRARRPGRAFASLALRGLLPVAAAVATGSSDDDNPLPVAIGVAAAMVVDWTLLTRMPSASATVSPAPGGATVGLAGTF